ncbi:GNAT family N-acetyltransferase [Streptomyces sp. NPDC058773]|uniref:GNAT family N-acetyltransferase n=1 Tax=Streptomyces sp. NPDC058773 TaxID=3346632 RepID=UPI00368398A8
MTSTRRVLLRPATAADQADFFRTVLRTGVESVRLPTGRTEGPSRRSDAAFQVVNKSDGKVLGFSLLFALDQAGHIRCGTYLDPELNRLGAGSEAIALTINYAFAMFNVDRVITETTEASLGAFGMRPGDERVLSVLKDHLYFRGRHWNLYGFQVERSEWLEAA